MCKTVLSYLEKKVGDMEEQRQVELKMLQEEKEQLQTLIQRQTAIIGELEQQLLKVSSNNTVLHRQQQDLLETVNNLIHTISVGSARGESALQFIVTSLCYSILINERQTTYALFFYYVTNISFKFVTTYLTFKSLRQ